MADRRLSAYREKIERLSPTQAATQHTFSTLAVKWLETLRPTLKMSSFERREVSLKQIKPFLGNLPLRKFTASVFEEWAAKRSPEISASTYNNERDTIIAVFAYAKRDGLILDNHAEILPRRKLPKSQIVIPSKEEFGKLVNTLRNMDCRYLEAANLIEVLAYSGMRLAEATSLQWKNVDFTAKRFAVTGGETGTKNHEVREVPLFPALGEFLKKLHAEEHSEPETRVITIDSAKNAMTTACRKAGLTRFTHHSLRHYFVSNAIEAGIDFKVIANWVGHKDGGLLVAKTYGHLRDAHSQEMAKRMTFSAPSLQTS